MKNVAMGILCSLVFVLTACGGGGGSTSTKPKSSVSSAAVSSTSLANSSNNSSTAVSSVGVSGTSEMSSSITASNAATSIATSFASSQPLSSNPASSAPASSVASSSSSAPVLVQTGVFIDSAVAGVKFEASPSGLNGFTSPTGQYQFADGDTVIFSIGDLKFPAVPAKGVVTPVDIAGSADPVNAERIKINIAALLQSLDVDGNPDNGIGIDYETAKISAVSVEFNQPYADFATSPAVTALVANSGSVTTTLVSESVAAAHLEESLAQVNARSLVGTWYINGQNGGNVYEYVLFVIDEQNYAAIDYDSTFGASGAALELGTYTWDQATGKVKVTVTSKTPSELDAAAPMANNNTLVLEGNILTLSDADESFELTRLLPSAAKPLKGGWSIINEENKIFLALTDTHYFMGQQSDADDAGWPGVELGTYIYNTDTNAIVVDTDVDRNGQWGISHPCAVLNENDAHPDYEQSNYLACGPDGRDIVQTLNVTGDTLTFISEADTINNEGEEDPFMFERVDGLPDGDIHLRLELTLTLTEYSQGPLYQNGNATMQCDMYEERAVGDIEMVNESWVLGANSNRPTWLAAQLANFNSQTNAISFDEYQPIRPVLSNPTFKEEFWDSFKGEYRPGQGEVITGTYIEKYNLTWTLDSSVSTCEATYEVTGVLR